MVFSILLCISLLAGCSPAAGNQDAPPPAATGGVLDLREYSLESLGTLQLEGEWDFYWRRLLTPGEFYRGGNEVIAARQGIRIPSKWNDLQVGGEKIGGSGYATYRLRVFLDGPQQDLALQVPYIYTAYRIWVNGEELAHVGTVGMNADMGRADFEPKLLRFHAKGQVDIVLQVSNFHHRQGGMWRAPALGTEPAMEQRRMSAVALDMLVIGSLFAMGLHHAGLFALRRKERGSIYFGLFCILIGIRATLISEGVFFYFFSTVPWLTALRIEYFCFFIGVPVMSMFVHSLYPFELRREVVRFIQAGGAIFTLLIFLFPVPWMTHTVLFYQIFTLLVSGYILVCLGQALLRGREGAIFAVAGSGTYVLTIAIDILYYNQWILIGEVSSYGLLVCVFMTSFILSAKSSKAFKSVEMLSRQMREMNTGLEQKIRERTAELEQINRSLERMNEDLARMETSRRHLLSNISHDLGTPMTLIQGYVEALIDGVVTQPEQQQKYLKLIHNRITGLNRLIADLFQLSKLEARQMDFDIHPVSTDDFIRYFDERYELELAGAGLRFEMISHTMQQRSGTQAFVRIDLDRIDQVLTNVIYNAVKHTPKGGLIQLQFIVDEHSLVVQVQDNGSGIDPEDLPHIFDRFYKKDKSRNTGGGGSGSGLGLAITKEIIDYHGGRIWAQSRVGQGACIAFMLPLMKHDE